MRLIKDIIEKELEIKNFCFLRRYYVRSLWKFNQAYNWAIALLVLEGKIKDTKELRIKLNNKNRLYLKILKSSKITEKQFKLMNEQMRDDFSIINQAIEHINQLNINLSASYGSFYRKGIVAVDMDEFPIN